jgi:hypothetical protein
MSETTALLKAGATDLVLRMAEAGAELPQLTLDKPVQAIGEVSRDITGRTLLRLADGRADPAPAGPPRPRPDGAVPSGRARQNWACQNWALSSLISWTRSSSWA